MYYNMGRNDQRKSKVDKNEKVFYNKYPIDFDDSDRIRIHVYKKSLEFYK